MSFFFCSTDAPAKTVSNAQTQAPGQVPQATTAAPTGVISRPISGPRFHWTHAIYAIGILAVSGAGTAVLFKVQITSSSIMPSILHTPNPPPPPKQKKCAYAVFICLLGSKIIGLRTTVLKITFCVF